MRKKSKNNPAIIIIIINVIKSAGTIMHKEWHPSKYFFPTLSYSYSLSEMIKRRSTQMSWSQ